MFGSITLPPTLAAGSRKLPDPSDAAEASLSIIDPPLVCPPTVHTRLTTSGTGDHVKILNESLKQGTTL